MEHLWPQERARTPYPHKWFKNRIWIKKTTYISMIPISSQSPRNRSSTTTLAASHWVHEAGQPVDQFWELVFKITMETTCSNSLLFRYSYLFLKSQAFIVFRFCETGGRGKLFCWFCNGYLLHRIYEFAQMLNVLWISFKVAMAATLDPQRIIFFLGKFPQSLSMRPINNVIICTLQALINKYASMMPEIKLEEPQLICNWRIILPKVLTVFPY